MVSRSTATLNSLNGWPGTELRRAEHLLSVEALDAVHLQVADEVLRPLFDPEHDRDVAGPAFVVVLRSRGSP